MWGLGILRKKALLFGTPLIFILIVTALFFNAFNHVKYPFKTGVSEIVVNKGDTLYSVLDKLNSKDSIYNISFIKVYIKNKGYKTSIKPGVYKFSKGTTLEQFIETLKNGQVDKDIILFTIPEGYNVNHIAERLEEKGIIKKDDFLLSCAEYAIPDYIKVDVNRRYSLEGYLFPDTYELKKGMKGKDIIDIMIIRFQKVLADIEKSTGKVIEKKDIDKLIIMASIIEKEVEKSDERAKASSVFYNRLKIGMKLQSCATVLYGNSKYALKPNEILLVKDTQIPSAYNTYMLDGLPVGPISCPGKECIIASLEPAKTNFLYFVLQKDGTSFFTDNYSEHLKHEGK